MSSEPAQAHHFDTFKVPLVDWAIEDHIGPEGPPQIEPNTGYYARMICDSIGPNWIRLSTMEICFPRYVLAEFNTHKRFSRNSASSRAIPVEKQLTRIQEFPFIPARFPLNQPGMSAGKYVGPEDGDEYHELLALWYEARNSAMFYARKFMEKGVHKQLANRLIEPFAWHTVIVTATEWENFFNLRDHDGADPGIRIIARLMKEVYNQSEPTHLKYGEWHLPYVLDEERELFSNDELLDISAGRCAAVTLLNQGKVNAPKDMERAATLKINGHMSPFEHQARALYPETVLPQAQWSNLEGWLQYRKTIPGEAVFDK